MPVIFESFAICYSERTWLAWHDSTNRREKLTRHPITFISSENCFFFFRIANRVYDFCPVITLVDIAPRRELDSRGGKLWISQSRSGQRGASRTARSKYLASELSRNQTFSLRSGLRNNFPTNSRCDFFLFYVRCTSRHFGQIIADDPPITVALSTNVKVIA